MHPSDDQETIPHKYKDAAEASRIYLLPNALTAGNLFFGFWSIISCIDAKYVHTASPNNGYMWAVFCILLSCICDALDGRVARIGGRESLFGAEFDSLADVVSFGLAPTLMVVFLIMDPAKGFPIFTQLSYVIGFIYLLCAAVRLARFNVITSPLLPSNQTAGGVPSKDFVGLPVPAAAGMVASLVLVIITYENDLPKLITFALPVFLLLIAFLMVSRIPYPSFKKFAWTTKGEIGTFILIFVGLIVCAFIFKKVIFSIIFMAYIFFGLFRFFVKQFRAYKIRMRKRNNHDN